MATETIKRKRKLMVFAPLFITPFLCLLFWAADGGKGKVDNIQQTGLNTNIPTTTNNQILGKDAAYAKMLQDSLNKLKIQQENYVYSNDLYKSALVPTGLNTSVGNNAPDPLLADVNKSLSSMAEEIKKSDQSNQPARSPAEEYADQMRMTQELLKADPQYQALMGQLNLGNTKPDSLNAKVVSKQEENFIPVQNEPAVNAAIFTLNQTEGDKEGRFYSGTTFKQKRNGVNTISAVIHNDQTIKEGTVIKLRLIGDINLSGLIIPRNTFVYGVANLGDERLMVTVSSISYQNSIYPVKLMVYDIDGLPGIKIPGSVNQAAAKQSTNDIINAGTGSFGSSGAGGVTVNQSTSAKQQIVGQLTSSAIESGKQLLSKKLGEVKVFLKANYHIFLKQSS
ncbi:MAG: conjugative transposon protein TraM [Chitinophagaceae bacterium]|nr:conjugative transposon protein TraM [Chitinophagaceae bacterium]